MHGFDTALHETQMKLCHVGFNVLTAVAMKRSNTITPQKIVHFVLDVQMITFHKSNYF
jgi:hypothetical protein